MNWHLLQLIAVWQLAFVHHVYQQRFPGIPAPSAVPKIWLFGTAIAVLIGRAIWIMLAIDLAGIINNAMFSGYLRVIQ